MRRKTKSGFTLIETVMVMIILAIVAGMGVFALGRFYELWLFSNYKLEVLTPSGNLMRDLTFNIRMVRDKTSVYTATATRFRFYNFCNSYLAAQCVPGITDYQFLNNKLYKNGVQIASEVASFTFTYYSCNKSGACNLVAVPAVSPASTNINTVKIDFTLTNAQQSILPDAQRSISVESTVNLRNLN